MTPLQSIERELTMHAGALRALASDLVGEGAADDLVQETALRALQSPPADPRGLFHWLACILRRLASKHRRGERRRGTRERAAARPEALPPADAVAGRREVLRSLTDAVLELPEPYQATLIQRYFEGLTPTEIAARTGVPLATVKSRLQRGLASIRGELERRGRGRDWRAGLVALTGLTLPARPWLVSAGVLLMAPTTKILTVASVLAAVVAWFAFGNGPAAPPVAEAVGANDATAAAATDGSNPAPPAASERREVAGPTADAPDLEHAYAYSLSCRVVDADGLPVKGAQLYVAPESCALDAWDGKSDADGRVDMQWRGKSETMTVAIATRPGRKLLRRIELRAGVRRDIALLAEAGARLTFRLFRAGSEAVEGVVVTGIGGFDPSGSRHCPRNDPGAAADCRSCHATARPRGLFDARLPIREGLHPQARFADLLLPSPDGDGDGEAPTKVGAPLIVAVNGGRIRFSPAEPDGDQESPEDLKLGRVTGTVYGPDGEPAVDVAVVLGDPSADGAKRGRTDADGRFEFDEVPPGNLPLRCGGGEQGLASTDCAVLAGSTSSKEVFLDRGSVVRGRAVDAGGKPLAGWQVEYVGDSVAWADSTTVGKDGAFVLANLPAGTGHLLLWPSEHASLPAAVERNVQPGAGEVVFDLKKRGAPDGTLRLTPELPGDVGAVEVRVWQQDSGIGTTMTRDDDGAFVLGNLPAGFYRVALGAQSFGWRDLGAQWVDGEHVADLGPIELPRPGRVRLVRAGEVDGLPELYERRPACDVRAEHAEAAAKDDLVLPAGAWLCLWRTPDGVLGSREFTVRPGETTEVRVGEN